MNAASYGGSFTDVNINASDLHIVEHADYQELDDPDDIAELKKE